MTALADKGCRFHPNPHLLLDNDYWKGGVFNQPSENWPLTPAIQFASAQVRELPLLNPDIDFITEGYLNQEIDLEKITTGSNLIRFADQPPKLTPPFWNLFSRY